MTLRVCALTGRTISKPSQQYKCPLAVPVTSVPLGFFTNRSAMLWRDLSLVDFLVPPTVSTRSASPNRYPEVAAHNNGCTFPFTLNMGLCAHNEFSSPSLVLQNRTLPPTSLGIPPVIKKYLEWPVKCTNNIFAREEGRQATNVPSVQSPRWVRHTAKVQSMSFEMEAMRLPSCAKETQAFGAGFATAAASFSAAVAVSASSSAAAAGPVV